jgi:hypothetical protein
MRPEVPLHTNSSERDIRDHVKKQKIRSGARSKLGPQRRDNFSGLKKTCHKIDILFRDYLSNRMSCADQISPPASPRRTMHRPLRFSNMPACSPRY